MIPLETCGSRELVSKTYFQSALGGAFMRVFATDLLLIAGLTSACSHNPHKAKKIDTEIEKSTPISGDTSLGIKDGNMVVQRKVQMSEELRALQNEVYELEDRVFGNRKY